MALFKPNTLDLGLAYDFFLANGRRNVSLGLKYACVVSLDVTAL